MLILKIKYRKDLLELKINFLREFKYVKEKVHSCKENTIRNSIYFSVIYACEWTFKYLVIYSVDMYLCVYADIKHCY